MDHPLEGVRAKLDRGDKHLKALDRSIARLMESSKRPRLRLRTEVHLKPGRPELICLIDYVSPLPLRFGAIAGDAIHNYRSALDQLIFELAFIDSGGVEQLKTAFPASDTHTNFNSSYVQSTLLSGLTKRHRAMVKRYQPCRGWDGYGPHPIRLLDDLSNDDKHRLIQPSLVTPQSLEVNFPDGVVGRDCHFPEHGNFVFHQLIGRPLEADTEVFRTPLVVTGPNPHMNVECRADVFVGLRNGVELDGGLRRISRLAHTIVNAFAPEFETRKALRLRTKPRYGRIEPGRQIVPTKFSARAPSNVQFGRVSMS